jgi:mannan endo-1,4-beta-mannosidase
LNRTNIYTGIQYKDDPTIMTWELANEPRCLSAGAYPRGPDCTTDTLIEWADDISAYIKSIDGSHLVSVGDEGFYCIPGATDWTENCGEGVDTLAFTALPNVDVMSFHLYPDHWGKSVEWGAHWIVRHIKDARRLGKPAMLGEFGLLDKGIRNVVYYQWTQAVLTTNGAGALYWILSGAENGGLYPDYDGFTVYCPSPVCTTISNFSRMMTNKHAVKTLPPVADNDEAVTEFELPVTLSPAANDIAYFGATVLPGTIDLDPATPNQQTTVTVYGGTFALQADASVLFTPDPGFSGKAQASYTITDSAGLTSNVALLTVTVKPNPSGALPLFSFETGTEGWASANWQSNAGVTEQSSDFATDGSQGLKVTTADGGWFGVTFPAPVDLTGKIKIKLDIKTGAVGTSQNVALQLGDGWTWCQGTWGWVNSGSTATTELDLLSLGCASPDLTKLQGMYVWFSGGGTFYMDYVRAE